MWKKCHWSVLLCFHAKTSQEMHKNWPQLLVAGPLVLHDNARPHIADVVTKKTSRLWVASVTSCALQSIYESISAHSPTFPSLHLRHKSFSNPSVVLPTSQLILQPFSCFTYVTAHSPTLPLLHARHSSFSNPSVASRTPQLILQPFFRFSYVTGSSLASPGEPPMVDTRI